MRLVATGLSILALAACQSADRSNDLPGLPEGFSSGPLAEPPSQDRSVEDSLAQVIRASRIVDGRRVVELDLCNRAPGALAFAYSVEWLDRAGQRVLDLQAVWIALMLAANESRPIELVAPSPLADSWRLMAVALPGE
jgi:uncharacterized protein YcfL